MERDFFRAETTYPKQYHQLVDRAVEEEKKEVDHMPIAINTNRPPSVPPNGGGNGPPRTTTSRRGGRTRSRSPPVVGGRGDVIPGANGASGAGGNTGTDNPSSAAAAAAAAAKNFSTSGGGAAGGGAVRSTWPAEGGEDSPFVEKQYTGSRHQQQHQQQQWLGEQDYGMRRYPPVSYGGGATPFRQYPSESMDYGDRRGGGVPRNTYQPQRYDTDRGGGGSARYSSPPPSRYPPQEAYRYDHAVSTSSHHSRHHPPQRSGSGGTSIVLGGATPIHVPKKPGGSYDRGGSAASVFRGRPDKDPRAAASAAEDDEDSPQKILLSLRTPTTSFEDKGVDKSKRGGLALSPTDPPQIHNAHHGRPSSDALFEHQKSPLEVAKSGSIDMAPSFTLFNQSFDSFGDGNYFHVDSALQNDSFGMARANSSEVNEAGTTQLLHKTSSVGNASQLLASGSGALTIGYSPVNSFGNASASAASRRGDMVLGGSDGRSASPSQVLNIYRSYSSGRPDMLEDAHMRMSVGSFGAGPSLSYGGPRPSFGDAPPTSYYGMRAGDERGPHFYVLLQKFKCAFKECTFLLPGLKSALLETPETEGTDPGDPSGSKSLHGGPPSRFPDPTPQDIVVARRRVECSICAFGGSLNRERSMQAKANNSGKETIFRGKDEPEEQKCVTVTPSSSIASPPGSHVQSQARMKYEEALQGRYYENESRLSWEFEESPPVEIPNEEDVGQDPNTKSEGDDTDSTDSKDKSEGDTVCKPVGDDQDASSKSGTSSSPQPKMRYRCKLCGQPKQNHRCPYQQSLARSIGIMVYPAVNAFTAAEPGTIATPLSDMNNFTDIMKDSASSTDDTPSRPTPDRMRRLATGTVSTSTQVTPESLRSNQMHPGSPFTTPARSGNRHRSGRQGGINKKRSYSQVAGASEDHDLLFVEAMEIKHEQFRVICESKARDKHDAYSYPSLPLPYAQRKKLSDNLFSLSNEVPKLTDECAQVLREAREKDLWDLAVAELMTQVIVILHCPDGDNRFDGLRTYLLTLGIAC